MLLGFHKRFRIFSQDLAREARATADNTRGKHQAFSPSHLTDGDSLTYWAADNRVTRAEIVLDFVRPVTFSRSNHEERY